MLGAPKILFGPNTVTFLVSAHDIESHDRGTKVYPSSTIAEVQYREHNWDEGEHSCRPGHREWEIGVFMLNTADVRHGMEKGHVECVFLMRFWERMI